MKRFEVKLRCCSSVVIQMLFAILGATKERNIFGYDRLYMTLDFFQYRYLYDEQ